MKLFLKHNKGFSWFSNGQLHVKGYAFVEDEYLTDHKLCSFFNDTNSDHLFTEKLKKCNGSFAIVVNKPGYFAAAVDYIRSIPLFYTDSALSDQVEQLKKLQQEPIIKSQVLREFFAAGYISGTETVLENIYQIQAGTFISKTNELLKTTRYFDYVHKNLPELTEDEYYSKLMKCVQNVFGRIRQVVKDNHLIIPLSAGYDSRLVAFGCKLAGFKNVTCFTYGTKNSYEVTGAKKIAKALGYRIHFVDYSKGSRKLYNSRLMKEYDEYSFNYVSTPLIQDLQAINDLIQTKVIPDNSYIVTGHSGDFISGRHMRDYFSFNNNLELAQVIEEILKRQFCIYKPNAAEWKFFHNKTSALQKEYTKYDSATIYENWVWRERQAKFLVNTMRSFEFFNLKWLLPLWDLELVNFFLELPKKYRINQTFYIQFIKSLFPDIEWVLNKPGKFDWIFDVRFKRYGLKEFIKMCKLSLVYKDFNFNNRRLLHKFNLVRFDYLRKMHKR